MRLKIQIIEMKKRKLNTNQLSVIINRIKQMYLLFIKVEEHTHSI
jgi:hypothetical protein